jgi:D-amino-acid dehydrogenase
MAIARTRSAWSTRWLAPFYATAGKSFPAACSTSNSIRTGSHRLITDDGPVPVETLVVAAGAWSHELASKLGHKVPLETQRGYHALLADLNTGPHRNVQWSEHKFIATPMETGLRFAGTVEIAGLDAPPDYRRADKLLEHGREMLPGLTGSQVSRWMGHRPCLPDSVRSDRALV